MSENNALAGAPILDAVLLLYGKGIDERLDGVPLTAGERDAILAVLREPPPSRALAKLRAMLVSDRAQRLAQ